LVQFAANDQEFGSTGHDIFTERIGALGPTCAAIFSETPHSTGDSKLPYVPHRPPCELFLFLRLKKSSKVKKKYKIWL
jgi:hypothetical protein